MTYGNQIYDDETDFVQAGPGGAGGSQTAVTLSRSWSCVVSGTAAAFGAGVPPGAGRVGILGLNTGTTTTGQARISTTGTGLAALSALQWMYSQTVLGLPILSTNVESYQVFAGFGDVVGALTQSQLQANFLYDAQGVAVGGVASPNWQVWVRDGASLIVIPLDGAVHGGIATVAAPVGVVGWPASTNVNNLEITVVPGANVKFSINGVVVATVPAPAASNAGSMGHVMAIYKSAGTTTRALQMDYARLSLERVSLPAP